MEVESVFDEFRETLSVKFFKKLKFLNLKNLFKNKLDQIKPMTKLQSSTIFNKTQLFLTFFSSQTSNLFKFLQMKLFLKMTCFSLELQFLNKTQKFFLISLQIAFKNLSSGSAFTSSRRNSDKSTFSPLFLANNRNCKLRYLWKRAQRKGIFIMLGSCSVRETTSLMQYLRYTIT